MTDQEVTFPKGTGVHKVGVHVIETGEVETEGISKMKPRSFILLGLLILLIVSAITIGFSKSPKKNNFFELRAQNEKFKLSFFPQVSEKDDLSLFFDNIGLPSKFQKEIVFGLDATTSANLSWIIPAQSSFDASEKKFTFTGTLDQPTQLEDVELSPLQIPKKTTLAIFSPNLTDFILARLNYSSDLEIKIKEILKPQNGHLLIFFGSENNFALMYKNANVDLSSFKEVPLDGGNDELGTVFVRSNENAQSASAVVYKIDENLIFTNSTEALKQFNEELSSSTLFTKEQKKAALIIKYNQQEQYNLDGLYDFMLGSNLKDYYFKESVAPTVEKLKEMEFSLIGKSFSGLISLK